MVKKVALLTAGGFAPCLSSAIGGLIERYTELAPDVEIIAYRYGYQGLLQGDSITVTPTVREHAALLHAVRRVADRQLPGEADQRMPTWSSAVWWPRASTRCRPRPTG